MERLYLKWKDLNNNIYKIATLYRYEEYYYLIINKEDMNAAMENGCVGIGNIDVDVPGLKSKELFAFFKNRILSNKSENISSYLKEYGLAEYDEMKLLKATKGYTGTDRYYLEEE